MEHGLGIELYEEQFSRLKGELDDGTWPIVNRRTVPCLIMSKYIVTPKPS